MLRKIFLFTVAVAAVIALTAVLPAGAQTSYDTRAEARLLSDASASAASPDAELLRIYQPVLVLHPGESFQPTKIQSFVTDSELERFTGTSPAQLPLDRYWTVVDPHPGPGDLPPSTPGVFYRLNQVGCSAGAPLADETCYTNAWASGSGGDAVYGRVARTADRIVLQYWLFYYDDALLLPPTPLESSGSRTKATGKSSTSSLTGTSSRSRPRTASTAPASGCPGRRSKSHRQTARTPSLTWRSGRMRTTSAPAPALSA
jgi:hypothetical protein